MATMEAPVSAAERSVSPASMPSPPEYVGRSLERAISMEKYAILREGRSRGRIWPVDNTFMWRSVPLCRQERAAAVHQRASANVYATNNGSTANRPCPHWMLALREQFTN